MSISKPHPKSGIVRIKKTDLARGIKHGFRSGLERLISSEITAEGQTYEYESIKLKYTQPAQVRSYTPDFILDNGIIVETKGRFLPADRKKMLLVKESHPELDIRFVFSNANQPIYKGSKTTHAMWCDNHGFPWAHRHIPKGWLKEPRRSLHPCEIAA